MENNTNNCNESFKIKMFRLPLELIISKSEYKKLDFLIEKSIDQYNEFTYNKTCGFL